MNKYDLMVKRNRVMALVRHSNKSGSHRNCIRISTSNSLIHEHAKMEKAYELIKQGHKIVTEAIFENGGRADILDLDTGTIFEILKSETEEMAIMKRLKYPPGLSIVLVDAYTLKDHTRPATPQPRLKGSLVRFTAL